MAQKRTTLRGWKKPEDGKSSACRLISSFVCIFGGIKWDCSKSLTIDCAEQLRTNPSVPGQGRPFSYQATISMSARPSCLGSPAGFAPVELGKLDKARSQEQRVASRLA